MIKPKTKHLYIPARERFRDLDQMPHGTNATDFQSPRMIRMGFINTCNLVDRVRLGIS